MVEKVQNLFNNVSWQSDTFSELFFLADRLLHSFHKTVGYISQNESFSQVAQAKEKFMRK